MVFTPRKIWMEFPKSRFETSTRWIKPWPFDPRSLEVTIHHFQGSLGHNPKKVTSRMARYIFPLPKSMAMIFFNFQVFSASAGRWYAAEVGQVEGQGAGQDCWTIRSIFLWLMIRSTSVGSGELGYGNAFFWWFGLWNNIYIYTFYN